MRPVDAGLCRYESYVTGVLHIEDVAVMNDWLDVRAENERRAAAARKP